MRTSAYFEKQRQEKQTTAPPPLLKPCILLNADAVEKKPKGMERWVKQTNQNPSPCGFSQSQQTQSQEAIRSKKTKQVPISSAIETLKKRTFSSLEEKGSRSSSLSLSSSSLSSSSSPNRPEKTKTETQDTEEIAQKRQKTTLPVSVSNPMFSNSTQQPPLLVRDTSQVSIVYTDGSCLGNHLPAEKRKAGIGVFFGDNDPRNLSEPFVQPTVSNNSAETQAVIRLLETFPVHCPLCVRTDSSYVLGFIEKRAPYVARNNQWASIPNGNLLKRLWELICEKRKQTTLTFEHVRGHSDCYGNNQADILAVRASKR